MSRAADVCMGIVLAGSIWSWRIIATGADDATGVPFVFFAVSRAVTACFLTRLVYREYLR